MWLLKRFNRSSRIKDAKKYQKIKFLFLATGSQGEPMGAMNRIINGIHPDVNLEAQDCVIFFLLKLFQEMKKNYTISKI